MGYPQQPYEQGGSSPYHYPPGSGSQSPQHQHQNQHQQQWQQPYNQDPRYAHSNEQPPPYLEHPTAPTQSNSSQIPMPAESPQQRPDAPDEQSQRALATFGSPYAHSKDWAPTRDDTVLFSLPKQAFNMRVKQRFARTAGDIFNPPAPSFQRPFSDQWSYQPFVPLSIKAQGKLIADGFKPLYPGRVLADHDVSAADWARFLEDIQVAGRLSGGQSLFSQIAPVTMHLGASGFFITKAIEKNLKKRKEPAIAETVEVWQQNFFVPRRLDVYIVDANERLTARQPGEAIPGTPLAATPAHNDHKLDDSDSSDDSSDSSDDEADHHHPSSHAGSNVEGLTSKQIRRQRKRERKAARRASKQERKSNKSERKQKRKEVKRSTATLIIAPLT